LRAHNRARRNSVVIDERHTRRDAHKKRRNLKVIAIFVDRNDGGTGFAIHEAGEQRKIPKLP
jgi:hypothetical protein